MKRVKLLFGKVLGGLFMLPMLVWSQCPNLNFSYGNLNFWQCYKGSCSSGNYSVFQAACQPGSIDIMNAVVLQNNGNFYDENCNVIKKVPDGYNFSCKLGNSITGAEVDGIEYTMTVDSMSSLLMLSFAWVMEDPQHPSEQQPRFTMKIKDVNNNVIQSLPCSDVSFISNRLGKDLACSGDINARDWTKVGFSLNGVIGQQIKIYFETWDCTQSGHFGYSYIVGECLPMEIELAYCASSSAARMTAPEGFTEYEWRRSSNPSWKETTPRINVQSPHDGEIFTVTVTSSLGCEATLTTKIEKTSINAAFMYGVQGYYPNDPPKHVNLQRHQTSWYDTCARRATFVDMSTVRNSRKKNILWEIKGPGLKGAESRDSLFTYTFPDPDTPTTYLVKLTAYATNGCADTSNPQNHYITIYPSPKVKITGPEELCEGKTNYLFAKTVRSKFVNHSWSWKKNNNETGTAQGDSLLINGPGAYYIQSKDTNGCYAYDTFYVTSLKPIITGLDITHVKCNGDATGGFKHGAITGGSGGGFLRASWVIWDDAIKDFKDTSILAQLGGTNTNIMFNNQVAGTYYFYGEDTAHCAVELTITITQPDTFHFEPVTKSAVCLKPNGAIIFQDTTVQDGYYVSGGTPYKQRQRVPYDISMIAPDGSTIIFDNKGVHRYDTAIYNLPAGIYIATVKDTFNCTKETVLEIIETPYPYLTLDTIVKAKCDLPNGSIRVSLHDARGPYKFGWIPVVNSRGDSLKSNIPGNLAPGKYTLHFTDANGCPIDTTFQVDSFPAPKLTYTLRPEVCHRENGEITVKVKSDSPKDSLKYIWTKPSMLPDTTVDTMITNLLAGTYIIVVTDEFCEVSDTIKVPHIDGPVANFVSNSYTVPVNVIFMLTDQTRGNSPFVWSWDFGDGNYENGYTSPFIRHDYEETGDYIVFMEVRDTNDCVDTISKRIRVYDQLHVYIPNTFTPNGDGKNETWKPVIEEYSKEEGAYVLSVYDRWGQQVFHSTNPEEGWDGTIKGKPAQNNTIYSYRLRIRDLTDQDHEYVGEVGIVR